MSMARPGAGGHSAGPTLIRCPTSPPGTHPFNPGIHGRQLVTARADRRHHPQQPRQRRVPRDNPMRRRAPGPRPDRPRRRRLPGPENRDPRPNWWTRSSPVTQSRPEKPSTPTGESPSGREARTTSPRARTSSHALTDNPSPSKNFPGSSTLDYLLSEALDGLLLQRGRRTLTSEPGWTASCRRRLRTVAYI